MRLEKHLYNDMKQHALEAFPEECCGFVLYDSENDTEILRRVRNVATERHQKDPANFPRDGRDGYVMDEKPLPILYIDEQAAEAQLGRLAEVRRQRDQARVDRALAALATAARGSENTMYPLLECVRAYATVGEMCDSLRQVWGEYEEVPSI